MLYMVYTKGSQMLGLEDPYISSLEETMNYEEVGKVPLNKLAKPLFEILEGGDSTVDLDAENYRQYIHVRLRNIIKTYPDGELKVTNNYYPLRRCSEEDFQRTDYERNYWEVNKDGRAQYCVDDNGEAYMQGTRDS